MANNWRENLRKAILGDKSSKQYRVRQTKNQKEYIKEIRKLEKRLKPIQEAGYLIDIDYSPTKRRITKADIEAVRNATKRNLLKQGKIINPATGEVVTKTFTPEQRQEQARKDFILEHQGIYPEDINATYNPATETYDIPTPYYQEYGQYEDAVQEARFYIDDMVNLINSNVLSKAWEDYKGGRQEAEAVDQLADSGALNKFQEALETAYQYEPKSDYVSGRAVLEAVEILQDSTPLTAQQMLDIAKSGYAD